MVSVDGTCKMVNVAGSSRAQLMPYRDGMSMKSGACVHVCMLAWLDACMLHARMVVCVHMCASPHM